MKVPAAAASGQAPAVRLLSSRAGTGRAVPIGADPGPSCPVTPGRCGVCSVRGGGEVGLKLGEGQP